MSTVGILLQNETVFVTSVTSGWTAFEGSTAVDFRPVDAFDLHFQDKQFLISVIGQ